eukprot:10329385-Alexandrium_andersonii.AAC.1
MRAARDSHEGVQQMRGAGEESEGAGGIARCQGRVEPLRGRWSCRVDEALAARLAWAKRTTTPLAASASPSYMWLFDCPSHSITGARGVRPAKRWARPRLRARRCADEQR